MAQCIRSLHLALKDGAFRGKPVDRSGMPEDPERKRSRAGLVICRRSEGSRVRNFDHLLSLIRRKRDLRPPQFPRRASPQGSASRLWAAGPGSLPAHAPDGRHLSVPSLCRPPSQSESSSKLPSLCGQRPSRIVGDLRIPFLFFHPAKGAR